MKLGKYCLGVPAQQFMIWAFAFNVVHRLALLVQFVRL